MMVSAANSKDNPKLAKLFDCILNTQEYFRYVNDLYWVYDENVISDIVRIDLKLSAKDVASNNQHVHFFLKGSKSNGTQANSGIFKVEDLSDDLKHSLGKKYGEIGKDKLNTLLGGSISDVDKLADFAPSDCASVGNEPTIKGSEISKGDAGFIDGWNVGAACEYLIRNAKSSTQHACAAYVERAIAAGGGPLSQKMACGEGRYATNLRYRGILKDNGFVMIENGTVSNYGDAKVPLQSGDVAIIGKDALKEGGKYHACMYCSKGWISDFKQNHMSPYSGTWPYAVYRFHNKQKT
jgi:hypothetical protein